MSRLKGKVAIITGAGNGQGAFEAELFAKEGATVVATDIDFEKVSEVVDTIQSNKGTAIAIHHDIFSELGWKKVVETTIHSFGKIDILVNNAGVHKETAMSEIKLAEWNKMIEINLT